ncbi:fibronectin type III domain-containing protein [Runella sp.]|uniref:fibronectin type III domain-containing protein n=1 Tax=Runella sp. TaxID=1960881 RepID=UPI003D0AA65B
MKKTLLILCLLCPILCEVTIGQTKIGIKTPPKSTVRPPESEEPGACIGVAVKAIKGHIYIRWVPTMQSYWEFGYQSGYVLERINTKTNRKTTLHAGIKPMPATLWKPFLDKNDRNYTILYAAIYEPQEYSKDILQQLSERRQLYQFALFGADMSFEAACMAGIGFVDSTAVAGERYQYIIRHKIAPKYGLSPTVSAEVGLSDHIPLPNIAEFSGVGGTNNATLFATTKTLKKDYIQYRIERSTDSLQFKSISDLPIVVTNKRDSLLVSDTLKDNDIYYYYRIKGLTLFQEEGPYSKIIKLKGKSNLPRPEIYSAQELSKDTIEVTWLYRDSLNKYITNYQLVGSLLRDGPYTPISGDIPPEQHYYNFKPLTPTKGFSFYIKLRTYPKRGEMMETLPYPIVLTDDDPPARPKGLKGKIEVKKDIGIVTLSWDANTDSDLMGYFLNRKIGVETDFSRVNNKVMTHTTLTDTIQLSHIQKYVTYSVNAMDELFKQSENSEPLILPIPDLYPPTSPIIDSFAVEDKKIFLRWTRSYSDDVQKHILYRKKLPSAAWEEVLTLTDTLQHTYADTNVVEKSLYAYTLIAFDGDNNQSEPASAVILETPFFTRTVHFLHFTSVVDTTDYRVKISWECNEADKIDNFLIYRALPNQELAFVKKMDKNNREWRDSIEIAPNAAYKYVIRAKMQEGYLSGWKETVIELKQ